MKVVTPSGQTIELGTTETAPTIGIIDYSRRVTDDFGVTTVVERGFARRMSVRLAVPFDDADALQLRLAELRATSALWVADDRYQALKVSGFYKDFSIDLAVPPTSFCTLTVEGLKVSEPIVDGGSDPSPDGQASTLQLLQPTLVTNAVLTASNIPETDYPAWAPTATYGLGARVIKAATHRVYESATAGNSGNDPANASGKWLDVGPTNRWAMFDQALGTVTEAQASIVVTLNAAAADAIALIDANAETVRVVGTDYDQTTLIGKAATKIISVPSTAGALTITIAGSGTVSIGTLLIGRLLALGTTEAAPTAGITDYSRKEVNDFGDVKVVERAWSKRMTARALIRTDALDDVVARVAQVRAIPSLWIGQAGMDSLTVYGFFKDFSIEVGEAVSKLSLTIEGLSKAAPIVPLDTGPVAWPDITDPLGTKPTNNADKTSENTAKDTAAVGGKPAADVLDAITAAKARQDVLEKETIPAVDKAVKDAGDRITAARAQADKALSDLGTETRRLDTRIDSAVAQGGYDDTNVYAAVRRVDQASIDRDTAAARTAETTEARLGDAITAKGVEVTTAFTRADQVLASKQTELEASSRADPTMMNGNANFSDWPDTRSVPNGWGLPTADATAAGPSVITRVPGILGKWAMKTSFAGGRANFFPAVSGLNFSDPYGGIDPGMFGGPGWYVMEADLTLDSGSLVGSGFYCASYNSNGDAIADPSARFSDTSANGGPAPGAGLPGARYSFAVLLDFTNPNTRSFRFHPMVAWLGFPDGPAKVLRWHKAGVRAATPSEIAARRADTNADSALAKATAAENVLADLPNRYAAASRTSLLEAQINRQTDSVMNDAIVGVANSVNRAEDRVNARIEDRATVIADAKVGAVTETVRVLRSDYNGTAATVSQQAGAIAGLNGKSAAWVRVVADAGNGRAALSLWSDQYGGAWSLTGDGLIDGNLTINGTLKAKAFDRSSMSRYAESVWTGALTPSAGSRVMVPWSLGLSTIAPVGRFIYEFVAVVNTNAGQRTTTNRNGKPYYIDYVPDTGGLEVICRDPQGNGYRPRANGSDPVLATTDFAPLFQASIGNSNYDTGIIDDGDYYRREIAATYTVTRIELRLTWVAI